MAHADFFQASDKDGAGSFPGCMHAGCTEQGRFRAPAGPGRLREYLWFCLEHVRAYNASWNYHRGMSEAEIEADRRRAYFWDRPTWRLGSGPGAKIREAERQAWEFAGFDEAHRQHRANEAQAPRRASSEEERALNVLGLERNADFAEIRRRYRELVKRLHPDTNGGDQHAEEQLKRVTQAYATLKALHA